MSTHFDVTSLVVDYTHTAVVEHNIVCTIESQTYIHVRGGHHFNSTQATLSFFPFPLVLFSLSLSLSLYIYIYLFKKKKICTVKSHKKATAELQFPIPSKKDLVPSLHLFFLFLFLYDKIKPKDNWQTTFNFPFHRRKI